MCYLNDDFSKYNECVNSLINSCPNYKQLFGMINSYFGMTETSKFGLGILRCLTSKNFSIYNFLLSHIPSNIDNLSRYVSHLTFAYKISSKTDKIDDFNICMLQKYLCILNYKSTPPSQHSHSRYQKLNDNWLLAKFNKLCIEENLSYLLIPIIKMYDTVGWYFNDETNLIGMINKYLGLNLAKTVDDTIQINEIKETQIAIVFDSFSSPYQIQAIKYLALLFKASANLSLVPVYLESFGNTSNCPGTAFANNFDKNIPVPVFVDLGSFENYIMNSECRTMIFLAENLDRFFYIKIYNLLHSSLSYFWIPGLLNIVPIFNTYYNETHQMQIELLKTENLQKILKNLLLYLQPQRLYQIFANQKVNNFKIISKDQSVFNNFISSEVQRHYDSTFLVNKAVQLSDRASINEKHKVLTRYF